PIVIIDIKDCFFSIPLHPTDKQRFAFTVPSVNLAQPAQCWQWTVLPQGMKNSPVICQLYVAKAIAPLREGGADHDVVHYMDDILLAAPTEQQVEHLFQHAK
ncbi:POK25 protein, partial [Ciccaba nigrolineata]|nr:POK25 protein [Ciccaba nigrolineata]